ncbi:MAG: hypothetical protein ACF8PN_07845 [Phycisphaerales bacterium]
MNPGKPRIMRSSVAEASAHAHAEREPVFVPADSYVDDRGWSVLNLLQGVLRPEGQVNYTALFPGVIKAWHRHQKQADFWIAGCGHIRAGIHREDDDQTWTIIFGEKNPGTLIIPPPLWHGAATVGPTTATLLYYVTQSYDPNHPDEERRPYDALPDFPWTTQHR